MESKSGRRGTIEGLVQDLISTALFASSFLIARRNVVSEKRDNDGAARELYDIFLNEEAIAEHARQLYSRRRRQERLSFHDDVQNLVLNQEDELHSELSPYNDAVTGDFYPKNSNWNHFEFYNEIHRDDGHSSGQRNPVPKTVDSLAGDYQPGFFDDDSDAASLTSQDHFVWTEARYSFRPRNVTNLATIPSEQQMAIDPDGEQFSRQGNPSLLPGIPPNRDVPCRAVSLDDRTIYSLPLPNSGCENPLSLRRSLSIPELTATKPTSKSYQNNLLNQVRTQNRNARASYNARIMPEKLVMVRHGQSMGNVNEALYSSTPDNAMPLTKLGWEQARKAGKLLKDEVLRSSTSVHFIVSPYVRTVETFHGIVAAWCDPSNFNHITDRDKRLNAWYGRLIEMGLTWNEDPRIREQDFGNFQDPERIKQAKKDRHFFGAFYYRFPHGESASDVFDRTSTFLDSLWRSFDMNKNRNYVIVTHGISIRVLLARYFRYTIEQFHLLSNPRNCEMVTLEHDGGGRLQMAGRYEMDCRSDDDTGDTHVVGYKFYQRLRVLPPDCIRKVQIRIQYEDSPGEEAMRDC
jgi:broad specificity phosphatase PhoE